MRSSTKRTYLGLTISTLLACSLPVESAFERFEPPARWEILWGDVERCSGFRGDFHRVTWFSATGDNLPAGWWHPPHAIYLVSSMVDSVGGHNARDRQYTVMHEMLHDLIGRGGHGPAFQRCGLESLTWE